jgi:transposase
MNGQRLEGIPACDGRVLLELVQDLQREVVSLRQEVVELRRENAELRRENLELRQQAGYWKAQHARAVARITQLAAEVAQLRGENRQLQARLFGQKTEHASSRDRSNQLDGANQDPASQPPKRGQRAGRPGPGRRDYRHLPVREELHELSPDQRTCARCGEVFRPSNTDDCEQLEIEVRASRRRIRRRRYQRTCGGQSGPRTCIAPPPPKLIPQSILGVSLWVELLLGKFFHHHPIERQLSAWQLRDLDLAPGTVKGGLERLEPLFTGVYEAFLAHSAQADFAQADETRWLVFSEHEGKVGHRGWLWVVLTQDTVVFRLDPSRSHDVPEQHFPADAQLVLRVDRYSAYKAMAQVKLGLVILVFCWADVRRDFVEVGKGWEELKPWALAWLQRIRELYRHQRERLQAEVGSDAFVAADTDVRRTMANMQIQAATELADAKLREPARKVLTSLQEHGSGLTRFVDDLRLPLDNNASPARQSGTCRGPEKLLRIGIAVERPFSRDDVLDLCHADAQGTEPAKMVDLVPRKLRRVWWPSSGRHRILPALEPLTGAP